MAARIYGHAKVELAGKLEKKARESPSCINNRNHSHRAKNTVLPKGMRTSMPRELPIQNILAVLVLGVHSLGRQLTDIFLVSMVDNLQDTVLRN